MRHRPDLRPAEPDRVLDGHRRWGASLATALASLGTALERMDRRVGALEEQVLGVHTRLDQLSEDMRQGFRVLTERVGSIESRLAA